MKHVGATNFDVPRLKEMSEAGVKIVNNQVRRGGAALSSGRTGLALG